MFRPYGFLPCGVAGGLFAAALGLGLCLPPTPASAQDRSAQERLDRLERDLNMLQRQVYRGLPPPMIGPPGDGGGAVNAEIRMNRLEEQMRDLTGRVEELINQVAQFRQRIDQANSNVDLRLSHGPGPSGPLGSAEAPRGPGRAARGFPPPPPDLSEDEPPPGRFGRGAGLPPPPDETASDAPAPIFGTLTPPGAPRVATPGSMPPGPEQLASVGAAGRGGAAPLAPNTPPAAQYNHAFGLLKQADYGGAETELKDFVDQHPKDPMAGSAQYWLGETYYIRGRFMDAAAAFAEGYKRYPKSAKAPDGLLKLGMSLARANQKQNACLALAQLDHDFPTASAAIKDHAAAEKKRIGC